MKTLVLAVFTAYAAIGGMAYAAEIRAGDRFVFEETDISYNKKTMVLECTGKKNEHGDHLCGDYNVTPHLAIYPANGGRIESKLVKRPLAAGNSWENSFTLPSKSAVCEKRTFSYTARVSDLETVEVAGKTYAAHRIDQVGIFSTHCPRGGEIKYPLTITIWDDQIQPMWLKMVKEGDNPKNRQRWTTVLKEYVSTNPQTSSK